MVMSKRRAVLYRYMYPEMQPDRGDSAVHRSELDNDDMINESS